MFVFLKNKIECVWFFINVKRKFLKIKNFYQIKYHYLKKPYNKFIYKRKNLYTKEKIFLIKHAKLIKVIF